MAHTAKNDTKDQTNMLRGQIIDKSAEFENLLSDTSVSESFKSLTNNFNFIKRFLNILKWRSLLSV